MAVCFVIKNNLRHTEYIEWDNSPSREKAIEIRHTKSK